MNSLPWVSAAHRPTARSCAGARSGSSGGAPAIERRGLRGLAEQRDPGFGHLGPAGRGRVARDDAGDRDDALLPAAPGRPQGLRITDDDLDQARTVPQDQGTSRHRAPGGGAPSPRSGPRCRERPQAVRPPACGRGLPARLPSSSPPARRSPGGAGGGQVAVPPHLRRREPASAAVTRPAARAGKVSSPQARRPPSQLPAALSAAGFWRLLGLPSSPVTRPGYGSAASVPRE
jgi:hypothetical protein